MRLSEAMKLGSLDTFPIRGPFFSRFSDGEVCGACALGAALYAMGAVNNDPLGSLYRLWPILRIQIPACPVVACSEWQGSDQFTDRIIHLFEEHGWSREDVADWVATIEAQHDVPQPVAECAQRKG